MIDTVNLYKEISLEIIDLLKNDDMDKLDELLNKRQEILDKDDEKEKLRYLLIKNGILEIDEEISRLFDESLIKVRRQIKEYKRSQQATNCYTSSNRKNLQIFYKKV